MNILEKVGRWLRRRAEGESLQEDFDASVASRCGIHGPYGPLMGELKTKVDLDLEVAFRRMCAEEGTDHSAVLRNWVNEYVRGISYDKAVVLETERRTSKFTRKGPNGALGQMGARP